MTVAVVDIVSFIEIAGMTVMVGGMMVENGVDTTIMSIM